MRAARIDSERIQGSIEWSESDYNGDVAAALNRCDAAYLRGDRKTVVARANAYAAGSLLRSKHTSCRRSIVLWARVRADSSGNGSHIFMPAIELGHHRTHLVVLRAVPGDRPSENTMLRVEHRLSHLYDCGVEGGVFDKCREIVVDELLARGTVLPDKTVFVDNPHLDQYPDELLIPPGDVAVGLKYADGSYSNFVQLERR